MRGFLIFCACFSLLIFAQEEVSLADAVKEAREDVESSTRELVELRQEIQDQRVPMVKELDSLQEELAALRAEVSEIRNARNLRENQLRKLKAEVSQLRQEQDFVTSVMTEYRRAVETRAGLGELKVVQEQLRGEPAELWRAAKSWLQQRRGGYRSVGSVLDNAGLEIEGRFLHLGPVSYFVGDTEGRGGLVVLRPNSTLPGLYELSDTAPLQALADGKEALLPVDVSGGDAVKVVQAKPGPVEHLKQGGVVVVPLLLLGGVALVLAVLKTFNLNRMRVKITAGEMQLLQDLAVADRGELAEDNLPAAPLGELIRAAAQHRHASRENLEEILHEHVLAVVPRLESSLGTLAVLGGVAPLLGLLGTVSGMIHTFQLVTLFGSGNAKTLSGGISEALVTTELGLIIAIPILLVHAMLARKAKTALGELEQSGVMMVNALKSIPSER